MSYEGTENSQHSGEPIEIYEFIQDTTYWRYTSANIPIVKDSETFESISIERDEISQSQELMKNSIALRVIRDNPLASIFLNYSAELPVSLTIFRQHLVDANFIVYWKGKVTSFRPQESEISIECESILTSLKRNALAPKWTRMCRHALYSQTPFTCLVDRAAFASSGTTVTAISGVVITTNNANSQANGYYSNGLFEFNGTFRTIVGHTGNAVTINRPLQDLIVTSPIIIYPGCDHSTNHCINKFNNLPNYGGNPAWPNTNPFERRIY